MASSFLHQHTDAGVPGLNLAHVVGEIGAHLRHVGHELRQSALERIRLDAPERLAGAFLPFAVREGRSEPVAERLARLAIGEEGVEIVAHLGQQFLFRRLEGHAFAHQLRRVLGEVVEVASGLLVGVLLAAVGRVGGRAGAPDLVALADVIARVAQQQRVAGNAGVPLRSLENRAATRAEEILPRQQRTAARRAARRGDEGVLEQHALARHAVEVRRLEERIDGRAGFGGRVAVCVTAPVIGEAEEDVPRLRGGGGLAGKDAENGKECGKCGFHGAWFYGCDGTLPGDSDGVLVLARRCSAAAQADLPGQFRPRE